MTMARPPFKPILARPTNPGTLALVTVACGVYDNPRGGPECLEWESVIVVDLSNDPAVRPALRSLEATLNHVDLIENEVLPEHISAAIEQTVAQFSNVPRVVMLVLGEASTYGMMQLKTVLGALDRSAGLGACVVVAEDPVSWGAHPSVRGYIRSGKGRLGIDATQATLQAVSLIAPSIMVGIDLNDWCEALGTVGAPSTLVRALWCGHTEAHRSVEFLDSAELRTFETAAAIAVLPLYPFTQFRQTKVMLDALSGFVPKGATFVLSVPYELIRANEALNGPYRGILALCRP